MTLLELKPITPALIPAAVSLDCQCLGGLWNEAGYQRELESPNSDLLGLLAKPIANPALSTAPNGTAIPETPQAPQPSQTSYQASRTVSLIGIGCLWAILTEAHITLLAIHPNYRQQGLGKLMLCSLLQAARQRGLEWATLEVRASNQTAIRLYQQFGFQEAGRRRRYYQDTGEDGLILWRSQLQAPAFAASLQNWQQQACDRIAEHGWQLDRSSTWNRSLRLPTA